MVITKEITHGLAKEISRPIANGSPTGHQRIAKETDRQIAS
jgi:hypothetical protein